MNFIIKKIVLFGVLGVAVVFFGRVSAFWEGQKLASPVEQEIIAPVNSVDHGEEWVGGKVNVEASQSIVTNSEAALTGSQQVVDKAGAAAVSVAEFSERNVTPQFEQITIRVIAPQFVREYEVAVAAGAETKEVSVAELMEQARQKGLRYETKDFIGLGEYVKAVAGVAEDRKQGMYWIYYVNSAKATAGISAQRVGVGDLVEWRYEKSF